MTPAQKQVFDAMRRHGFLTDDYYDLTIQREKVKKEREEKGQDMSLGSFTRFPDILMMDGGKGQVYVALRVLDHLGLHIPVCGMGKFFCQIATFRGCIF